MTTLDNGTARDIAECALYVLRDIFAAAHAGEADAAAEAMLADQQAQADLWADEAQEDVL